MLLNLKQFTQSCENHYGNRAFHEDLKILLYLDKQFIATPLSLGIKEKRNDIGAKQNCIAETSEEQLLVHKECGLKGRYCTASLTQQ